MSKAQLLSQWMPKPTPPAVGDMISVKTVTGTQVQTQFGPAATGTGGTTLPAATAPGQVLQADAAKNPAWGDIDAGNY